MAKTLSNKREKRPIAISIVGIILLIAIGVYLYRAFIGLSTLNVFVYGIPRIVIENYRLTPQSRELLINLYLLSAGLLVIVLLIGFLSSQRWAWIGLLIWNFITLVILTIGYFGGHPQYIFMALGVILVFSLNQVEVRRLCDIYWEHEEGNETSV